MEGNNVMYKGDFGIAGATFISNIEDREISFSECQVIGGQPQVIGGRPGLYDKESILFHEIGHFYGFWTCA